MSYRQDVIRYHTDASNAGLGYDDAESLRRDTQRLHTIAEHECNGYLYRCEEPMQDHRGRDMVLNAVYQVSNINGPGPLHYYRTADRETGCRVRIEAIVAKLPGAILEFNGDPRGWPVLIQLPSGRTLCPPCRY